MVCCTKYICKPIYPNLSAENWDVVQYPFTRVTCWLFTGHTRYKEVQKAFSTRKVLSVLEHTVTSHHVLIGQSMWPVQLCITSLPPDIRMNVKYLLASVWLGPVKPPDFSMILKPVLERIHNLYSKGTSIVTPHGPRTLKAILLASVFDLPGKAAALNYV